MCLAGLPQQTHTSETVSSWNRMHRDLTPPVTSFSLSSQAVSPHHIALI